MASALDFSINQGEKTNLIYIKPSENAEELIASLVVTNSTDDQSIQFKAHSGTASRSNYHFMLRFKHGHLDNPAQIKLQTNGWSCHYQQYRQYDYIYFLATSSVSLSAHDDTTLQLQNLFASGVPGTTDVSLLWYDNTNYVAISGGNENYDPETDHTVNIANYTQQVYAPLHVGFVGSNTVLNDGTTENTLTLRLTNISNKPLALVNGPKKATFTLHFDYDPANNQDKEWALLDQNTANAIEMTVKHDNHSWREASKNNEQNQPIWTFSVPHNAQPLASYDFMDVTITGIKTAYPTGQTNLYLHTSNTPGHWDGYYTAVIEKCPLIYSGARVGIGTARPQGTLDIRSTASSTVVDIDCEGFANCDPSQQNATILEPDFLQWQSFTPNSSGDLESIEVCIHYLCGRESDCITLKIYAGEGMTDELLYEHRFSKPSLINDLDLAWVKFDLTSSVSLQAGQKYTFELDLKSGEGHWSYAQKNYPGGKSSASEGRDLAFKTYMRVQQPTLNLNGLAIHSTQNKLGIGTAAPQATLDVYGDAAISGQLTVGSLSRLTVNGDSTLSGTLTVNSPTTLKQLTVDGNSTLSNGLTVDGNSTLSGTLTVNGNTTLSDNLIVNRKLGIGTTSPSFPLEVRASGHGIYQTDGRVQVGMYIGSSAGWLGTKLNHPLHFFTDDSSPQMTLLNSSGKLGIGTTDPQAKLDVYGNIKVSGHAPIYFKKFKGLNCTNSNDTLFHDTGVSINEYGAAFVVGFYLAGDIDEDWKQDPLLAINTYKGTNNWMLCLTMLSNDTKPRWSVQVAFVRNEIIHTEGDVFSDINHKLF